MFNLSKTGSATLKAFQSSDLFSLSKKEVVNEEAVDKAVAITNLVFEAQNNRNVEEASIYAHYHYKYLSKLQELELKDITMVLKEMLNTSSPDIIARVALYYQCGWCTHNKPVTATGFCITTVRLKNVSEIEQWRQALKYQEEQSIPKYCCCFAYAKSQLNT